MQRFALVVLFICSCLVGYAQDWDHRLEKMGMKCVGEQDSNIRIHLMYAHPENIFGEAVYAGLTQAWLHPEAMEKLLKAQKLLRIQHPAYTLIVYDAARPMEVQRRMWALVRGTDKTNYVSNPANGGGLHNYGMAVDVSILDGKGNPLPMGSPIDFFGEEAHTNKEADLLRDGKITEQEYENRQLLRQVMRKAGFRTILYEWWHFNACSREEAKGRLPIIE